MGKSHRTKTQILETWRVAATVYCFVCNETVIPPNSGARAEWIREHSRCLTPETCREETPGEKTLDNSTVSQAKDNVPDLKVVGNGDSFQLLCKASSQAEGWMKSTKAMEVDGVGCVVQVTTHQRNHDGTNAVTEALTFVPGVAIVDDINGGRKLVSCVDAAKAHEAKAYAG